MKKYESTLGYRLAASFLMMVASFVTAFISWLFFSFLIGKADQAFIFPFNIVYYFTAVFTILAFVSPTLALYCMGWIWNKIEKFVKSILKEC